MKISLRKAAALQNSINEVIKNIAVKSTVQVSEFKDPEAVIAQARDTVMNNIKRKVNLLQAMYAIRKSVGAANAATIDDLLADVAQIEKEIQLYEPLATAEQREDSAVLAGKLDKIRNRPADSRPVYGYSDEVATSVLSDAELEYFRTSLAILKKKKQTLQDKILEANVRTEIELDTETVDLLREEHIL